MFSNYFSYTQHIFYSLPDWTQSVYPGGELEKLARLSFVQPTYTSEMAKLRSGFLLKEILDNSMKKFTNSSNTPSMVVYSAHHNTIANILHTIGLYNEDVRIFFFFY